MICKKCGKEFKGMWKNPDTGIYHRLHNRKFCLECSPFGQHNTRRLNQLKLLTGSRKCPRCAEIKDISEFYTRRNKQGSSTYCKSCTSDQCVERQRKLKLMAVNYLGGKCILCGYKKFLGALEFHHRDPKEKDFTISKNFKHRSFEFIKSELDKCDLVCANCHREIHAKLHLLPEV